MSVRRWFLILAPAVLVAALFALPPRFGGARDVDCDRALRRSLATGRGTFAVTERGVVSATHPDERCAAGRPSSRSVSLRHLASEPGEGTAWVEDRAGADDLLVVDEGGITRLSVGAEITHPAWSERGELVWSEDMRRLVVRYPDGTTQVIRPPADSSAIFSPLLRDRSLIAVVAEPREGSGEDAFLDNLWRRSEDGWSRLTDFDVSGTHWSAIRTPVVAPDGTILFVRVHGRWDRTSEPTFELWRLGDDVARKVLDLPGEMFLAGFRDGRLVWNAPTGRCDGWELLIETEGPLRSLGCGAVQVDPADVIDPDLASEAGPRAGVASDTGSAETAIVVGDFRRRTAAERIAALIGGAARVVTNAEAPSVVRPGVFAVVVPVDAAAAGAELDELRSALPHLERKLYVTTF